MVSIVHVAGFGTQGGTPSIVFGGPRRSTGEKYCTFPAKKRSGHPVCLGGRGFSQLRSLGMKHANMNLCQERNCVIAAPKQKLLVLVLLSFVAIVVLVTT